MKSVFAGCDSVPLNTQERFQSLFQIPLREGYGLTESSPAMLNPADAVRPEVEGAMYDHPAVGEAAVVGMPDPLQGERVAAFVSLRNGQQAGAGELKKHTRGRLADYKVPETILFLSELPKGLSGKLHRQALKQNTAGLLAVPPARP